VGLFVDASADYIHHVLQSVPLHMLQFHGSEDSFFCEQFKRPFMKALRVQAQCQVRDIQERSAGYKKASAILLDTFNANAAGGTGETFNWHCVPTESVVPFVLAGGLTPENVAEAVRTVRPYAVDVSSGVESKPGKKAREKIVDFIAQVKCAN
jgi:phosphoribosylanthranilate isomerase